MPEHTAVSPEFEAFNNRIENRPAILFRMNVILDLEGLPSADTIEEAWMRIRDNVNCHCSFAPPMGKKGTVCKRCREFGFKSHDPNAPRVQFERKEAASWEPYGSYQGPRSFSPFAQHANATD